MTSDGRVKRGLHTIACLRSQSNAWLVQVSFNDFTWPSRQPPDIKFKSKRLIYAPKLKKPLGVRFERDSSCFKGRCQFKRNNKQCKLGRKLTSDKGPEPRRIPSLWLALRCPRLKLRIWQQNAEQRNLVKSRYQQKNNPASGTPKQKTKFQTKNWQRSRGRDRISCWTSPVSLSRSDFIYLLEGLARRKDDYCTRCI